MSVNIYLKYISIINKKEKNDTYGDILLEPVAFYAFKAFLTTGVYGNRQYNYKLVKSFVITFSKT